MATVESAACAKGRRMSGDCLGQQSELSLGEKLRQINWPLILLLTASRRVGFAMLYSAGDGSIEPWASRQAMRFGVGLCDHGAGRRWSTSGSGCSLSYLIYGVALVLLVAVEIVGEIGMGAQRWIDLGVIQLQPSEMMKIALVLALARYFHGASLEDVRPPHCS